jgi:phosphonate transport system substrate-binding protein
MLKKFSTYIGVIFLFTFIGHFFLSACSDQQPEAPKESSVENSVSKTQKKFHLGLIPEQDLFSQKKRYRPLARYVSEKTGVEVELEILPRYGNIIDNFVSEKLDGAFFGSFTGALAIRKLGVDPLARPLWPDGTSTYYGMILVRKDSGIKSASDMKGKRFAFVDKATTAGWLLPLHYFNEIGINDYRTWFAETYFTGTHEDAIKDVLERKADIGAAKNTVFYRLAKQNSLLEKELRILSTSPKVPSNTLAVRESLESSFKAKLKNILLQMHEDKQGREILQKFGATRFIETSAQDYDPVFTYAAEIKLDLKKYDYINN